MQLDALVRINCKSRINPNVLKSEFSLKEAFRDGFPWKRTSFGKDIFDMYSKLSEANFIIFKQGFWK